MVVVVVVGVGFGVASGAAFAMWLFSVIPYCCICTNQVTVDDDGGASDSRDNLSAPCGQYPPDESVVGLDVEVLATRSVGPLVAENLCFSAKCLTYYWKLLFSSTTGGYSK